MTSTTIKKISVNDLIPYINNSRTHSDEQVLQIASSIKEFGFLNPIIVDGSNGIIAGHGRVMAAKKLGLDEVPCIDASHLSEAQKKAYIIADNKLALNAGWDDEILRIELNILDELDFDLSLTGFSDEELQALTEIEEIAPEYEEDADGEVIEPPPEPKTKEGDVWILGKHRLMCGDSTSIDAVDKLMTGGKADLVFTDPPYGMKKEKDGVLNDNLNYDDLLEFNREWISVSFSLLKDNASWYCWGIDEPLMDIYSEILKPMKKENLITFRNLLTWDKGHGQGQLSEDFRMYAPADEKCLFVMKGVQGFNTNSDNYFDGFEPIRKYLEDSRLEMGWDVATMKNVVGHSDKSRDHWTSKSQWTMPSKEVYNKMKAEADRLREETSNSAFLKTYDVIKKEYDVIKKEFYDSRAYFNNTHENMNNVWKFERTSTEERKGTGGHATPKPISLCSRAIVTSSRENEVVLDLFGGSGSTLIACEKTNRKAYLMELDPKYCDVIINRWQTLTGKEAVLESTGGTYNDTAA